MSTGYEIVMDNRKRILDELIASLEKGSIFPTEWSWNVNVFAPNNPISKVKYVGMNNYILTLQAMKNNYNDNRWVTFKQAVREGWRIRENEVRNWTLCEKWLWTKEIKVKNEEGEEEKKIIKLKKPFVRYFKVYNAEQIEGIPELDKNKDYREREDSIEKIANTFIKSFVIGSITMSVVFLVKGQNNFSMLDSVINIIKFILVQKEYKYISRDKNFKKAIP